MSRELDDLVHDKVMGLPREVPANVNGIDCFASTPLPHYTTDHAADYSVLVRVRETWGAGDLARMGQILSEAWLWREREKNKHVTADLPRWMHYQPGDYSKAALAALGAT